jgi:nucleoside-diphosphate-sugar epimerase
MRILVTGAQGCIGAWVVKRLLDRGLDVLIYDQAPEPVRLSLIASPEEISRVAVQTGAIEDTGRVKALVRDEGITHIVHLAAVLMPFCQATPVAGGMINVIGTLNVFEAARDAGRPVRVVYASSSAVWGPEDAYESRPLTEADPLKPATHYGVFKMANEGNARVFYTTNGISSIGLRPWVVYGVGRDRGLTADPTFALKAVALEQPYKIRLSGHIDLQYVEDVAETFIHCVLSDLEGAHAFNLAGDVITIENFIAEVERLSPGATRYLSNEGPQVPVAFRMDATQLHTQVPGIPRTSLADGITKTLELFRQLRKQGRLDEALAAAR